MSEDKIRRFSWGERFFHWANAGLYGVLFLTGTLLLIGRIFTLQSLPLALLGNIHRVCGILLVGLLGVILALSIKVPTFRDLWKTWRLCLTWKRSDILWLLKVPVNMINSRCSLPLVGRFNPGQKMHLLVVFSVLLGFSISGLTMICIPGALGAWVFHLVCFVPAFAFLCLHLFLSLINPETRKALPAMLTGLIPADYAQAHHALWDRVPQGASLHGSYVSLKWVCIVGALLFAGLGLAIGRHGFDQFASDLDTLVTSGGASAILPGPLCAQHLSEEELRACRSCHSVIWTVQDQTCLACHEVITERRQGQLGFHGTLAGSCRNCHAEHQGSLIDLEATDFTHEQALFPLEGLHLDVACETCHIDEEKGFRYIGIDYASCVSCHSDPHQDEQASACQDCHTPASWSFKDKAFDHAAETSFALKGKHVALACDTCHESEGQIQLFDLGQACLDCHEDLHDRQFVQSCDQCHTEEGFKEVRSEQFHGEPNTFLLKGKHEPLECQACHVIPDGQDKLAHAKFVGLGHACIDCHKDPHAGQFTQSCDQCHVETGFKEIRPEQFHGDPNTFVLKGKHEPLECQKCHLIPVGQDTLAQAQFVAVGKTCAHCHKDPHQDAMNVTCENCHQENGFVGSDLLFAHDAHTQFKLDAQHRPLQCNTCHEPGDLLYKAAGLACQDCHTLQSQALAGKALTLQLDPDPHYERLACSDCHDLSTAEQSKAQFAARCEDCHTPHYQALSENWQASLSSKQERLKNQIHQSSLTPAQQESLQHRLLEAGRIGFHNVQLAQELFERLHREARLR
ncbi:MAG: cytochrome b/b6 domain-containing protein [Phycisphaeraceae bacterium]|nr:cytochrome b/b6 domain-containing protein [Phycisphaeraceae bacterium]